MKTQTKTQKDYNRHLLARTQNQKAGYFSMVTTAGHLKKLYKLTNK